MGRSSYEIGTSVQVFGSFKDTRGRPFDPAILTCVVQKPSGVETTHTFGVGVEVVRENKGLFFLWLLTDEVGTWAYSYIGAGVQQVKKTGCFKVYPSPVASGFFPTPDPSPGPLTLTKQMLIDVQGYEIVATGNSALVLLPGGVNQIDLGPGGPP